MDFPAENIPQEILKILLPIPLLKRNFLRIILPSEYPQERSSFPTVLLTIPLTWKFRRYICGFSCGSSYLTFLWIFLQICFFLI